MTPAFSETRRQAVHVAMGAWALLLRWISWRQAAALAAAALVFNAFLLPRLGGVRLYRPAEVERGFPLAILLYPLAVLLLVLTFPHRLDIVAAAWGIMAAGDGLATIVGRAVGRTPLPWNREKTVEGSLTFVIAGSAAGVFLAWWVRPSVSPAPPLTFTLVAPVTAAIVAALVETIPVRLDDNISVPASAAATLWALSLVTVDPRDMTYLPRLLLIGTALNAAVAIAGWLARTVTVSGALAGLAIGTIVFVGAGWRGWAMLLSAFAEERGGRRGFGNAVANTGVAAGAAALAILSPYASACLLALTAALTAGASDTVASEIGKAWGRRTILLTRLTPAPPGTPGAVSLEGTAAGVLSALFLAGLGASLGLIPADRIWIVVFAATAAAFLESILGATLEPRGILNNDLLNFMTTASAAGLAMLLAGIAS
jgi:uncharacterized membrane protein